MANTFSTSGSAAIRWAAGATTTTTAKGYGPDSSCQPCPDCGGLECLCRPRFFAGQLLTEQDLNRLDHYITEKHKLHNRHLFGSGVVCGLVVTCAPCDERVNVSAGYALSPCGEDIVVCQPDSVDICELISRCRETTGPDCRPYAGQNPCDDVIEEWVLAVRYAETPSLPKTIVAGPSTCSCGCGTGASASKPKGGCSCGGSCGCSGAPATALGLKKTAMQQPRLRQGAPPTCEPTVTCESCRYDAFLKPDDKGKNPEGGRGEAGATFIGSLAGLFDRLEGDMAARIACCLHDLENALPRPPGDLNAATLNDRQAWFRWCCSVRAGLAAYFARTGGIDCEAIDKLGAVACANPDLPLADFKFAMGQSILAMMGPALEAVLQCVCLNILPPCSAPEDPRIPLAVVTIRKRDCHIIKVCNWTPLRRHVVTFPTLGYWLGWIPLRRILRDLMEQICCTDFNFARQVEPKANIAGAEMMHEHVVTPEPAAGGQPAWFDLHMEAIADPILVKAFARQLRQKEGLTITENDVFDFVFRRPGYALSGGLDAATQDRLATQIASGALMKVLGNLARSTGGLLPDGLTAAGPPTAGPPGAGPVNVDLAAMRQTLDQQARDIADLKARVERAAATTRREPRP